MRNLWVHITGPDRAGILGHFLAGVARLDLEVTDLEQVSVGDRLILAVGMRTPSELATAHHGLTELGNELGLSVELRDEVRETLSGDTMELVVTVLGEPVPSKALASVGQTLADFGANVRRIETLARKRLHCIEMLAVIPAESKKAISRALLGAASDSGADVSVQEEGIGRRAKRMVVMDVDSTLIQTEVIDELANFAGVGERVANITARAMNGELDFKGALAERVALLKGLPESTMDKVAERLAYTQGARSLIKVLKGMDYKTAILSGGFTYFTDRFKDELGLDYAYANSLEIADGKLTGRTTGPIVDGQRKKELVKEIAAKEGIRLDQVIVIGDGANDLPMMGVAGLGIAFNAKPRVREMAPHNINRKGLDSILFLLGIREEEIKRLEAAAH